MSRTTSLLAALAMGSCAALNLSQADGANAMTIAWDCFDRSSNALVARSSVDITSPAISCLPAAGAAQAASPGAAQPAESAATEVGSESETATTPEAGTETSTASETSTESAPASEESIGTILGSHLGKLIGQGLADLFR